jgi:diaminopimelate decarboxylase
MDSTETGRQLLRRVLTTTDVLDTSADGRLTIDGLVADSLLGEHGSPLFVISEAVIRANYRRVREAFTSRWPADVNVMFAIKANNALAVRAVLFDEGAGGDCFSEGEIYATFRAGASAALISLNGPNKTDAALSQAARLGACINLDSQQELEHVEEIATELGIRVRVVVRLRLQSAIFDERRERSPGLPDVNAILRQRENGLSVAAAAEVVRRALESSSLHLEGYHFHIGRESRMVEFHSAWAAALVEAVASLHAATGFAPMTLDIGGGLAREREPEAAPDDLLNSRSVDDYADAITGSLLAGLKSAGLPVPKLWLEPGRFIVGNAGVLLATVGGVKSDVGRMWVYVDASINDLPRIDNASWRYVCLPASRMDEPASFVANVVGSLCVGQPLARDLRVPKLQRGDAMAFLDAGMYAEVASTQYNAVPRPATVLVKGDQVDVIKERETLEDVFVRHRIPSRLVKSHDAGAIRPVQQTAGPTVTNTQDEEARR